MELKSKKSLVENQLKPEIKKKKLISREGKEIDISGDIWHLPYPSKVSSTLYFEKIADLDMREALKEYVSDRIKRTSISAGLKAFSDAWRMVLRHWDDNFDEPDAELN